MTKKNEEPSNEKPDEAKASSPRFGFLRKMSSKKKKHGASNRDLAKAEHNPMNRSLPNSKHGGHDVEDVGTNLAEHIKDESLDITDDDVSPSNDDNVNTATRPDMKVLNSQDSITIEARRTPKPETMAHVDAEDRPHNPVASELFNTSQDADGTAIDEVGYETPDDEEPQERTHPIAHRDPACFSDPTPAKKKLSIPSATPLTPDRHQQQKLDESSPRPGMIGTNFSSSSVSSPRASSERRLSIERNYTVRERHGAEWQKLHDMFENKNQGGSVPKLFDAPSSPRNNDAYAKSKASVGEIDSEHIKTVKELAKELNSRSPKKAEGSDATTTTFGGIDMRKAPLAPTLAQ